MEIKRKLLDEEYNNLYVTSDTHFNHNKEFVFKARGYNNPTDMTNHMIGVINETVGPSGILLHLGDFCLNTFLPGFISILNRLTVKELWLLNGNHNNPHSRLDYRELNTPYPITQLGDYFTFRHSKKCYVCFHFPLMVWDGVNQGSAHLCGHSHGDLSYSRPENKENKILDCGWDIWKRPLHIKEIEKIMDKKNIASVHHD